MTRNNEDIDAEAEERQEFWSEFLNTDEGHLVVGDLRKDEMKQFHADGFLFELTRAEDNKIQVKFVRRE